jgi:hypothetical protein
VVSWVASWPSKRDAHSVWALNLTAVGLVFMTHPQQSMHKVVAV